MASVLTQNPYTSQPHFFAHAAHATHSSPSPSISEDSTEKRLPSIQSLIKMSDPGKASPPERKCFSLLMSPRVCSHFRAVGAEMEKQHQQLGDSRPHAYAQPAVTKSEFGIDRIAQSPSAASSQSSTSGAQYFSNAINNVDPQLQQQAPPGQHHPLQAAQSPYQSSPYPESPSAMSSYSYPSPSQHPAAGPAIYYQRALPATFPPATVPTTVPPTMSAPHEASPVDQSNPWQHHHYISPSSSAAFAGQSQDRYVCQTCNKAFSRPSSLKIHSHSHTGEKPFKCPHAGCGKAFSVRSNMKRHERGCHGGGSPGPQQE